MRLMGLALIYQKPNTSRPTRRHKTYPFLLRGPQVEQSNQVWCSHITYPPIRREFLYLVAIMDWHAKKVLFLRILMILEAHFYIEALKGAIRKIGLAEIMSADQVSPFTSFG